MGEFRGKRGRRDEKGESARRVGSGEAVIL